MGTFNIEYARCMTKIEVDEFFSELIRKSNYKLDSYQKVIEVNWDLLIQYFHKYAKSISEEDAILESEYKIEFDAYVNEKCICGSNVRFVSGLNFYGCANYKSPGKHRNFVGHENAPYRRYPHDVSCYVTKILYDLDLKSSLNAKALFNFYRECGFPDLSLKYRRIPYSKTINTYLKVKNSATKFEKESACNLKLIYPRVQEQFGIIYKTVGDIERKCFLDILCSNNDVVHIYECKASQWSENDEQQEKYISLVKFLEPKGRTVKFTYLFETNRK